MSQVPLSESLHYQGKIKLIYNETNPRLRYQVSHQLPDNRWSPPTVISGVSSILNVIPKGYLVSWAGLVATEKAIELLDQPTIDAVRRFMTAYMEKYKCTAYEALKASRKQFPVLSDIATGHVAKGNEAKLVGTDSHNALEAYVLGTEYQCQTEGGAKALESYKKAVISVENPITEVAILSRQYNFAGRFDMLATIGGKRVMCDFKTNKRDKRYNPTGAHVENFVQMALYALAWNEEHNEKIDELAVINVDKENAEPAIVTYSSDFDMTPEELISIGISMKFVGDNIRNLESKWNGAKL